MKSNQFLFSRLNGAVVAVLESGYGGDEEVEDVTVRLGTGGLVLPLLISANTSLSANQANYSQAAHASFAF